jgi:glyoxylase-like metal-dependent hydrolase (beta-lactamase superfamily II)
MSVTRRTLVSAPALGLAGSLAGAAMAQTPSSAGGPAATSPTAAPAASGASAAAGQGGGQPGFYRYKLGDIEITAVHDGQAMRPLEGLIRNAELADVKKAAADAFLPTDALPITFTPMVVRSGGKTILFDSGNGDVGAPTAGRTRANLAAAGVDPTKVDIVIVSHFHGDHINGLRLKDGTAVYPNAEIMVPAPEWAFWMDDSKMSAAPEAMKGAFQGVRRVFGPMAKDVKHYEWGREIAPGITAIDASGHTPGHTAFGIQSGGKSMIQVIDITNHPALFATHPDWAAVFDMDAEKAKATRRRMLDMAATERTQLAFYHAPFPATGHVRRDGNGYEFVPVQWVSGT